jgi:hypothetical protein
MDEGKLYIEENCKNEFKMHLNQVFGIDRWKLVGDKYKNYNSSTIPKNISVPIIDNNEKFIGRADIINDFEIKQNEQGYRYVVAVPFKIEIHKFKLNERVCMQCINTRMHEETLHNKEGCIVDGCECKIVNLR